jgi:hypothetical protein
VIRLLLVLVALALLSPAPAAAQETPRMGGVLKVATTAARLYF